MCVEVEDAAEWAERRGRVFVAVGEPLVPVPDDRALAGARVDDDEGDLIARPFNHLCILDVHALVFERAPATLAHSMSCGVSPITITRSMASAGMS